MLWCRGAPHLVGSRHPEFRVLHRSAADRNRLHAGAAGIAGFADAIHQDRCRGSLCSPCHVKDRPGRPLVLPYLFLKQHQPLEESLRPRGAAGDIDIHRNDLVYPLHHAVDIVHAPRVGATPHGDHPPRFGHLLVQPEDGRSHLLEHRAGNHHQIGLARSPAQHFGAEAGDVVAGSEGGHHFDETAGKAEEHRPERVGAPPVDEVVKTGEEDIIGDMLSGYFTHHTSRDGSAFTTGHRRRRHG